jgi:hypothetical protein
MPGLGKSRSLALAPRSSSRHPRGSVSWRQAPSPHAVGGQTPPKVPKYLHIPPIQRFVERFVFLRFGSSYVFLSSVLTLHTNFLTGSTRSILKLLDQIMVFSLSRQTWRQTHFGTQANADNAADTAYFDQDGLDNLVEYAFGLSPMLASNGHLPQPSFNGSSLAYSFT